MKKQKKQFLFFVVALFVLIGAYFGVDKYVAYVESKATEEELSGKTYITDLDATAIQKIGFEYAGESLSFIKENDVWVYEEDKTLEIKQEKINAMAEAVAKLAVENKIETVTDLTQYGLTAPSRNVSFTANDVEYMWYVGNMNDLTGVYYMHEASDPTTVYTVTANFLSNFNYGIGGLVVEEATEEIIEEATEVSSEA